MQAEMKCPNCGGDKFKSINEQSLKCLYCGSVISQKKENMQAENKERETIKVQISDSLLQKSIQEEKNSKKAVIPIIIIVLWVVFLATPVKVAPIILIPLIVLTISLIKRYNKTSD